MTVENKLRNILVRRIQKLSPEKLDEMLKLLSNMESELTGKVNTLKLAGSWQELEPNLLNDFTTLLHQNRK